MKKRIISIVIIILLTPFTSRAQYFDWVQTYTGSEATGITSTNKIKQSVIDSAGNVYFIGNCSFDADFNGEHFSTFNPYGPYWNTASTVIGMISTEGNLVWKKTINNNNGDHQRGGNIQLVGDSSIVSLVNITTVPSALNSYLFFLDTLYRLWYYDTNGREVVVRELAYNGDTLSYPMFSTGMQTAYICMGLDGNVKETHWLAATLLDGERNPFPFSDSFGDGQVQNSPLSNIEIPFVVDDKGCLYAITPLRTEVFFYDSVLGFLEYDVSSPEISGIRFYVDGKRYFDVPLPDVRPSTGLRNYQILKFSPHFEELLASQFLFEPTPEHLDTISYQVVINALKCDSHNNIFLSGYSITDEPFIRSGDSVSLTIGGSDSLDLFFRCFDRRRGFLIKYDSALNPLYIKQLDRVTDDIPTSEDYYTDFLLPLGFDDEGKIVIFEVAHALYDTVNTHYYYDSTEVTARSSVMLRIDPEDGRLISKGKGIKAEVASAGGSSSAGVVDFAAKNNRVIWQIKYRWWLDFAGERYEKAEATQWGMGFAVWDYDGNELCFVDYGINGSLNNGIRSICLVDSVLYLTGMLASGGAQFGDVTVYNSGSSQSFIARYVDTAFMHPYVHHGDLQDIQLVVRGGEPVATVYPNPCAQRVTVDWDGDEPPVAATVTDITGRTYSVALAAAGAGHSDSEAKITGRYTVDFSSLPAANYLLTITTPSGHRVTTRLLKR